MPKHRVIPSTITSAATMLFVLVLSNPVSAESRWLLEDTMTGVTLNGVSTGNDGFTVLVGDGGTIVHQDRQGTSSIMPSGTTADLFDVYVVDATTAVATGRGVVLRWNGTNWSTILNDPSNAIYTSVWVTPEKDAAVFNIPTGTFTFHNVYDMVNESLLPFSLLSGFDIAYCGGSGDIKTVVADGSVMNYDNVLEPIPGTAMGVIYDNSAAPLNLTSAWILPGACIPGVVPPLRVFAIHNNREFYVLDPMVGWTLMPVAGGSIPAEHTLNWLGGSGTENLFAVGSKPSSPDDNDAVVWTWDGQMWTEDTDLPPNTPGLTDFAYQVGFVDEVFNDGFEDPVLDKVQPGPGVTVDVRAAGEKGTSLTSDDVTAFFKGSIDLAIEVELLTEGPYIPGSDITVQFRMKNNSAPPVTEVGWYARVAQGPAGLSPYRPVGETLMIQVNGQNRCELLASVTEGYLNDMISLAGHEEIRCNISFRLLNDLVANPSLYIFGLIVSLTTEPIKSNNQWGLTTSLD